MLRLWAAFLFVVLSLLPSISARAAMPAARASQLLPSLPLAHADDEDGSASGGLAHFVRWIGHFHPAATAFPIAMLLSAALAELLRMIRGTAWLDGASRWCVIVGAVGAVIAAPLGWAFALGHDSTRLLETHRWLGTALAIVAVAVLLLSEAAHRPANGKWRGIFRAVLFLAAPLAGITGFFGGAMVYGIHEYDWNRGHAHEESSSEDVSPAGSQPSTQASVVTVTMTDDDAFQPASITIPAGGTVRWTNASKETHTVTNDPAAASSPAHVAMPSGAKLFNSGKIKPGGSFEQSFTVPGTYRYVCEPHEEMDMKGQVIVQPPPG